MPAPIENAPRPTEDVAPATVDSATVGIEAHIPPGVLTRRPVVASSVARKHVSRSELSVPTQDAPDPTRVALSSTALLHRPGELSWQTSDILLQEVDYGLSERTEIGVAAALPVAYLAVFPKLKIAGRLSQHLFWGVEARGGVFWPYADTLNAVFTGRGLVVGAGPILTWVTRDLVVNVSVPTYGIRYGKTEYQLQKSAESTRMLSRIDFGNTVFALPSVGAIWSVTDHTRIHAEAHVPLGRFDNVGRLAAVIYGFRAGMDSAFIDLSFVVPIYPGATDFLRKMPVGIPLLSGGMRWDLENEG